jgi:hypothetical protein
MAAKKRRKSMRRGLSGSPKHHTAKAQEYIEMAEKSLDNATRFSSGCSERFYKLTAASEWLALSAEHHVEGGGKYSPPGWTDVYNQLGTATRGFKQSCLVGFRKHLDGMRKRRK